MHDSGSSIGPKPSNVRGPQSAEDLDFGLARFDTTRRHEQVHSGTIAYMSPSASRADRGDDTLFRWGRSPTSCGLLRLLPGLDPPELYSNHQPVPAAPSTFADSRRGSMPSCKCMAR